MASKNEKHGRGTRQSGACPHTHHVVSTEGVHTGLSKWQGSTAVGTKSRRARGGAHNAIHHADLCC